MLNKRRGKSSQNQSTTTATDTNNKNKSTSTTSNTPKSGLNTSPTSPIQHTPDYDATRDKQKQFQFHNRERPQRHTIRPVTLRTEVIALIYSIRRTFWSLQQRWKRRKSTLPNSSGKSPSSRRKSNHPFASSWLLVALVVLLTLEAVWYLQGSEDRRRIELCRLHRSRQEASSYRMSNVRFDRMPLSSNDQEQRLRFEHVPTILPDDEDDGSDYGGIEFRFFGSYVERRKRRRRLDDLNDYPWHTFTDVDEEPGDNWDAYYAFDDDDMRNSEWKNDPRTCRRVAWHRMYNPSCNQVHELEIISGENRYLGSGFYRDVFQVTETTHNPNLVYKLNRIKANPFSYQTYEFIRNDALIMERLTSSPRIPDIFGHCGTSMLTEYLSDEIEPEMIPGSGKYYGKDLNNSAQVRQFNDYSPKEKLEMALVMAEALADLHGFKDGVIVHDDLMPSQFLYATDGSIKLNDFNRGEIMLFDEEHGEYCRYRNGKGGGDFRSPEEFKDGRLNEKIDVFSMGNMMYGLLTGLLVFYDVKDDKKIQKRLINGDKAYIDPRYRTKSFAESKLVDIIERCWEYDPDERADIFEVVTHLKDALDHIQSQEDTLNQIRAV